MTDSAEQEASTVNDGVTVSPSFPPAPRKPLHDHQQKDDAHVQDVRRAPATTPERSTRRGLRQGALQTAEADTAWGQQGGKDLPPSSLRQGHV